MSRPAPDYCPACGAAVPSKARACPECGSDESTGWSERAYADNLGIPEESFDYDEFVEREFKGKQPKRKFGWLWVVAAILVLLALVLGLIRY